MALSAKHEKRLLESTLFTGCDSKNYRSLTQSLTTDSILKGQSLSTHNISPSLIMLASGCLDIYMPTGVLLVTLMPGDFFEPSPIFSQIKPLFPLYLRARANSVIITLDKNSLVPIFDIDPVVARNYMKILDDNLQTIICRLSHFTAVTPSVALALYLLRSDDNILRLPEGFAGLARRLNISRATFYRALSELEQQKLISHYEKTIRITDRKGLLAFARINSEISANFLSK